MRPRADRVLQAMAAVKPKGSTNMYAAFEAAFRLRGQRLDTIYVLSDGLPNIGQGLPADAGRSHGGPSGARSSASTSARTLKTDWNRDEAPGRASASTRSASSTKARTVGAFLWALARENDGSFVGMPP